MDGGKLELAQLRMAHLLEVATGFRSGDPLRPGPAEPKPEYDPDTTTLTARRRHTKLVSQHRSGANFRGTRIRFDETGQEPRRPESVAISST